MWDAAKPEEGSGHRESHVGGAKDGALRELGGGLVWKERGRKLSGELR